MSCEAGGLVKGDSTGVAQMLSKAIVVLDVGLELLCIGKGPVATPTKA